MNSQPPPPDVHALVRVRLIRIGGEESVYDGDERLVRAQVVRVAGVIYQYKGHDRHAEHGWCRNFYEVKLVELVVSDGVLGRR